MRDTRFLAPPAGGPSPLQDLERDGATYPFGSVPTVRGVRTRNARRSRTSRLARNQLVGTRPRPDDDRRLHARSGCVGHMARPPLRSNGHSVRVKTAAGFAVEALLAGNTTSGIEGRFDRPPHASADDVGDHVMIVAIPRANEGVTIAIVDQSDRLQLQSIAVSARFRSRRYAAWRSMQDSPRRKLAAIRNLQYYLPATGSCVQSRSRFRGNGPLGSVGDLDPMGTDTMATRRVRNTSSWQPDQPTCMSDTEALEVAPHGDQRQGAMSRPFSTVVPGIDVAAKAWQEGGSVDQGWLGMDSPRGSALDAVRHAPARKTYACRWRAQVPLDRLDEWSARVGRRAGQRDPHGR